jgi:hypothetical protein
VGGETRLVGLSRTASYSHFLQQLSKATSTVWDEVSRQFAARMVMNMVVVMCFVAAASAAGVSAGTEFWRLFVEKKELGFCGWRDAACGPE